MMKRILIGLVALIALAGVANAAPMMDTSSLPGGPLPANQLAGQQFTGSILDGATVVDTWTLTVTAQNNSIGLAGSTDGKIAPILEMGTANFLEQSVSFGKTWSGVEIYYDFPHTPPISGSFLTTDDFQTFTLSGGAVWNVLSSNNVTITGAGTSTLTIDASASAANYRIAASAPISGFTHRYDNDSAINPNGTTYWVDFQNAAVVPEPSRIALLLVGSALLGGYTLLRRRQLQSLAIP